MVDNFSTIFESENSLSLLPFFLPLTIPIFIEEFPFPTEKRKRWKSWRLQKFYRLVPSRDRFRIACNIEGRGGEGDCALPFGRSILNAFYLCNGALLITFQTGRYYDCIRLHNAFRRIPALVTERRKNCTDVLPFSPFSTKNETFLLHYLPYIHTYFHRLHSTRSTFPFSFPLLLRFFTEEIRPAPNHRRATKIPRTHTHMQRTRISRSSKNHFRNRGSRYSTGLLADISGIRAIPVISLTFETLIARIRMVTGRYYSELPYLAVRLFLFDPHIAPREIMEAIISTIGRSTTERERIMTRCFVLRATEIVRIGLKRV